jgi:hypothetical protein
MYHTIEFAADTMVDIEFAPTEHLERLRIRKGTRRKAQVRPHVVDTETGPIEVADLFFDDGTATSMVPFESFFFVD